jgi:hypothetical protein
MTVLAEICDTVNSLALMFFAYAEVLLGRQAYGPMEQFRLPLVTKYPSSANWLGHRLTMP